MTAEETAASNAAAAHDLTLFDRDPRLFLFTSLTAGSSHIITATSRIETILKANRIPFQALDLATDEKARRLWQRRAGGRKLPGLVKDGFVIADINEVEDWNEFGELKENIGPVPGGPPAASAAAPVQVPQQATAGAQASTAAALSSTQEVGKQQETKADPMRDLAAQAASIARDRQKGLPVTKTSAKPAEVEPEDGKTVDTSNKQEIKDSDAAAAAVEPTSTKETTTAERSPIAKQALDGAASEYIETLSKNVALPGEAAAIGEANPTAVVTEAGAAREPSAEAVTSEHNTTPTNIALSDEAGAIGDSAPSTGTAPKSKSGKESTPGEDNAIPKNIALSGEAGAIGEPAPDTTGPRQEDVAREAPDAAKNIALSGEAAAIGAPPLESAAPSTTATATSDTSGTDETADKPLTVAEVHNIALFGEAAAIGDPAPAAATPATATQVGQKETSQSEANTGASAAAEEPLVLVADEEPGPALVPESDVKEPAAGSGASASQESKNATVEEATVSGATVLALLPSNPAGPGPTATAEHITADATDTVDTEKEEKGTKAAITTEKPGPQDPVPRAAEVEVVPAGDEDATEPTAIVSDATVDSAEKEEQKETTTDEA